MALTTPEAQVGAALKKARHKEKVSLRTMAEAIGTDHSEVARMERGRPSPLTKYARVADVLGYDLVVRLRKRRAA